MDLNYAKKLIKETENNYNLLARDYDRTRAFVPIDIKSLAERASFGDRVLDSGCANGRLFEVLKEKEIDYFGIDISEKLIEIAKKKYPGRNFKLLML